MRQFSLPATLLACLAIISVAAFGQTFYGTVVGSVQDSTGAVIPGASVTITSLGTGEQRVQETEGSGLYRFVNLVPGQYRLEARSEGFKQFVQEPIVVEVEASIRIDPVLEIGEVTEVVEVVSSTPLLQSQTSSLGQVVESRKVTETPLNGRNVLNLVALAPGVVPQGQSMQSPTRSEHFRLGQLPDRRRPVEPECYHVGRCARQHRLRQLDRPCANARRRPGVQDPDQQSRCRVWSLRRRRNQP